MPELIEPGELQQNIQTPNETARATTRIDAHVLWRGTAPPESYSRVFRRNKTMIAASTVAI